MTYTGRWHDEETGLYHYRARAYDPLRGTFFQRDPLGVFEACHLYEYAASSPVSWADPVGEYRVDPSSEKYPDGKKAVAAAGDAGKRAGDVLKAILKRAIEANGPERKAFERVTKDWSLARLREALKLVDEFTRDNGRGIGLLLVGVVDGAIVPGGDPRIAKDNPCFADGQLWINYGLARRAGGGDEESLWQLVRIWLHEFMHYALWKTGSEHSNHNDKGEEVGNVFENMLQELAGDGSTGGPYHSPAANVARKVHDKYVPKEPEKRKE